MAGLSNLHLSAGMNGLHSYSVRWKMLPLGHPQDGHGEIKSTWPAQVKNRPEENIYFLLSTNDSRTDEMPLTRLSSTAPPPQSKLGKSQPSLLWIPPFMCSASRPLPPPSHPHAASVERRARLRAIMSRCLLQPSCQELRCVTWVFPLCAPLHPDVCG